MTIKDYSSTAASNTAINGVSIAGTAPVSNMDDGLRNIMADISNWTDSDTLASGSTTDLGSVAGMYVTVSGAATITSFGTLKAGMVKFVRFSGAGTITYNATSMILPGSANITRANGDMAIFVSEGSGNWRCLHYTQTSGAPVAAIKGHIYGLTTSNNSTDATNDIDIAAGEAASDSSSPRLMVLSSALTKRLDATWAVGTGNGGLDTGSKANSTWYHLWLIMRSDTGVVDALYSTSATSPTMPSNYDHKRRIGAVKTDGAGAILPFVQEGDEFLWATAVLDVSVTDQSTTAISRTLSVPTGLKVRAKIRIGGSRVSSAWVMLISPFDADDAPASSAAAPLTSLYGVAGAADYKEIEVRTNTSGQVRSRSSTSATTLYIVTIGWVDTRGRL